MTDASQPSPSQSDMPHNIDIERSILAVILDGRQTTNSHFLRNARIDHPLFFWNQNHRLIYLACLEQDGYIDMQIVTERLGHYNAAAAIALFHRDQALLDAGPSFRLDRSHLREFWDDAIPSRAPTYTESALCAVGGIQAVLNLQSPNGSAVGFERSLSALKNLFQKRRLIVQLRAICERACRAPDEQGAIIDDVARIILDLGQNGDGPQIQSIAQLGDSSLSSVQHAINYPNEGMRMGIDNLDDHLADLRPGGLYIIAARPGIGKTSFALNMVRHICENTTPRRVVYVGLETNSVDLHKRLMASMAGVDFRKIEQGTTLLPDELEGLVAAHKKTEQWPLRVVDVADITINGLRSMARKIMAGNAGKFDLLVIDYLQLLRESRATMTDYERLSEVTRGLKMMARELKIPVVALSQMSRDGERGVPEKNRSPKLTDLRGSGTIEGDADAVIFLHRIDSDDSYDPDDGRIICHRIEVSIAKNRFGPKGKTTMNYFPSRMRFAPAPPEDYPAGHAPDQASRHKRLQAAPNIGEDLF